MRVITIIATVAALVGVTYGAHFRKNSWGDGEGKVIAEEGSPFYEQEKGEITILGYYGYFLGYAVKIEYLFKGGKLHEGSYLAIEDSLAPYDKWCAALVNKYGPGEIREGVTLVTWSTEATDIMLAAVGSGGTYKILVQYLEK